MNDQWKEYVDGMRTGLSPYSTRSVDRLLKLVDAQDAVVKAAAQSWSRVGDCAARGAAAAAAVAARRPLPLRAIARKAMTYV